MNRLGKPVAGGVPRTGSVSHSDLAGSESNDAARISQTAPGPQGRTHRYALCDPRTNPQRHRRRQPSERRLRQAEAIHAVGFYPLAQLLTEVCESGGDPEFYVQDFAERAGAL